MGEGARPSSAATSVATRTCTHPDILNPHILLTKTLSYGDAVWQKIYQISGTENLTTPFFNLLLIIEEQLQNIADLYSLSTATYSSSVNVNPLIQFYSNPELRSSQVKHNSLPLFHQIQFLAPVALPSASTQNYFSSLYQHIDSAMDNQAMTNLNSDTSLVMQSNTNKPKSFFVEDLDVSEVSDIVHDRLQQDRQTLATEEGVVDVAPLTPATTNLSLDVPVAQHLRINLIRHRHAKHNDMTVLKLFKSLIHTLRNVDKNISILPVDSKKQQYTALVSNKQIDNLNEHQLRIYFQPWHREQYYSLSGFIHISTMMSYDEFVTKAPLIEWLDTYQYSTKKCSSQSEEMAIIGALCYGSTWIHREDLKTHIMQHPEWMKINNDPDNPIIFDLLLRTFRGTKKSTPMIFVSTERSKQETVRETFKHIYDGTAKKYPRGEMMLFLPTRNGDQYSAEQREKIIFNHETYLGDEEVTAIHGLQSLNTEIILKGGKTTNIRTLLKSLPATDGMSRNRLFQIVDPNAGQTCTIVTFQRQDRDYVEQRKSSIEQEIRSVLQAGESSKVFLDDIEGLWFGGHVRKRNGKPISLSVPNKADQEYIKHAEALMNNYPKKRDHPDREKPSRPPTHITYSGMVQAQHTQTTQSISVQDPGGTTTTTTTQTSQTVTATMEARFHAIETEIRTQRDHQEGMNNRLSQLEHRTTTIDDNIAAMMNFWKITPTQKRKAAGDPETENYQMQLEADAGTAHATSDIDMDNGDSVP